MFLIQSLNEGSHTGADPGFGVGGGGEIRQGDLIVSDVYGTYDAGKVR